MKSNGLIEFSHHINDACTMLKNDWKNCREYDNHKLVSFVLFFFSYLPVLIIFSLYFNAMQFLLMICLFVF